MTKKKTRLMRFWAWIKKNWYYFLIIPLAITGFKVLYVLFSKGTDLVGMPDLTDEERDKEDKIIDLDKKRKEKQKEVEEKYEDKKDKIRNGEIKPSEVFNNEVDND